jgi:glucokinase
MGLIADIGGTNARFALVDENAQWHAERVLACQDFSSPTEAAKAYLAMEGYPLVKRGVFAVAAPVISDEVALTNHNWRFSVLATGAALGFDSFEVVNDFAAVALSLPHLKECDLKAIGGGKLLKNAPMAVLGPGTGLGVAGLVNGEPQPGEGGHATLPAMNAREYAVIEALRAEFGHVSAERVLSGPGLVNLYHALCRIDGVSPEALEPADVTARGVGGNCPICRETLDLFCAFLGIVAGNHALTLGAQGGFFIAGGIIPKIMDFFIKSSFRQRFEDKGRFRSYLSAIPCFVITHPYPAFLGLAKRVTDHKER